jgi:hypothetical protein
VDVQDRRLLEFVLAWAPYGGPPADEIFCEFGCSRTRLDEQFQQIMTAVVDQLTSLPRADRRLVERARSLRRVGAR